MQNPTENLDFYKQRLQQLEAELDEMTAALSQAWDQLVPFLQVVPDKADSSEDILPIIQAALMAVDADVASLFLLRHEEWFTIPEEIELPASLRDTLTTSLRPGKTLHWHSDAASPDPAVQWVFAPIVSERQVEGALGAMFRGMRRTVTAVDVRIIERMAERAANQIVSAHLAKSRELEAKARHEFQIASMIQRSIQPVNSPQIPGLEMAAFWEPAKQVGGDTWGWVAKGDKLAWFIVDVAGKGLPAALAAVSLHTAIRMGLRLGLSPTEVLETVNQEFYDAYTNTDLMATATILSINPSSGEFEQANAGHPPTLIRQGRAWRHLEASAPPIGVLPVLNVEPQCLTLDENDLILCYTDGLTEIETPDGLWGEQGLLKTIPQGAKNVEELAKHIVKMLDYIGKDQQFRDDQTLIILRFSKSRSVL